MAFAILSFLYHKYGWKSLLITSRRGLARQTATAFKEFAQGKLLIGQCGDGMKTIGDITVATATTLMQFQPRWVGGKTRPANLSLLRLIRTVKAIFFDETHHAGSSDIWFDVGTNAEEAILRAGASGTPLTNIELADLRMIGLTGPCVYSSDATSLIQSGNAAKPKIVMVVAQGASGPPLKEVPRWMRDQCRQIVWIRKRNGDQVYGEPNYMDLIQKGKLIQKGAYRLGVTENAHLNQAVIRCVKWFVERKRQTLVLCRRAEHFETLKKLIDATGISFLYIDGKTLTAERDQIKKSFEKRRIKVLLASEVMGEGENLKAIEAIVLAEGVKANTGTLQRIGRGMRVEDGGATDVWVVDMVPTCAEVLLRHGLIRCESYEREQYEVRVVDKWPKEGTINENDLLPFLKWK
jgi:superfamily II DNA or RNA helicase